MRSQTTKLVESTGTRNASVPNRLSRFLLALEALLIIFPLLILAIFLGFAFFVFWIPLVLASSIFNPEIDKAFLIISVAFSAFGSLAYLGNVTQLSLRYVFIGRPVLEQVTRLEWLLLWAGPVIPIAWAIIGFSNYGSRTDTPLTANSILFVPGLLLVPPSLHLFLAKRIAEYRLRNQ